MKILIESDFISKTYLLSPKVLKGEQAEKWKRDNPVDKHTNISGMEVLSNDPV